MNIKRTYQIIIASIMMLSLSFSAVDNVATRIGNWLKLEAGTRSIAMGGASTASGRGISAVTYNPSSIAFVDNQETFFSQTSFVADISFNILGYARNMSGVDYVGLHIFTLDSGEMLETTELFPEGTGRKFTYNAFCVRGTYARRVTDRLRIGVAGKFIREEALNSSLYMQTFALDIGSNFDTGLFEDDQGNGIILGMAVSNLGPEAKYQGPGLDTEDGQAFTTDFFSLPMQFRLGVMKTMAVGENHNFITSIDMITPIDYSLYGAIGMEYTWKDLVYARVGSKFGHDSSKLSIGGGFKLQANGFNVGLDYAFVDFGLLGSNHQFGINFTF